MNTRRAIPIQAALLALLAAGCASPPPVLEQQPLSQSQLDQFLAGGRDARNYGITIYPDAAGNRYEFANRVHLGRSAERDFILPRKLPVPVLKARTATFVNFHLLLDSSSRQNWLLLPSVQAMDYRPFAPPTGEYADHVVSDVPGYAGVANKIVLDTLHIESPVFCVPPAHGNLGPLARVGPPPAPEGDPQAILARQKLGARTHAVMGAALMRAFAYIRFDFPARKVRFSSSTAYRAPAPDAVLANLPLRDWRGRPAVQGTLDDRPITLVVDTAGDFDVAVPGPAEDAAGPLVLGSLQLDDVQVQTHAALGLPENFPARLGLGVLGRYIVTLDFKQQRVWIEGPPPAGPEKDTEATADESPAPVHYRGVKR